MFAPLFLTACVVYVLLDFWLVRGLRNLGTKAEEDTGGSPAGHPVVTVLVAARDEEANLPRTLDALLAQDWLRERLQIVVADDRSIDGTYGIIKDYEKRFPGVVESVRVEALPAGWSPKKHALSRGLAIARGEWIAITDADCVMRPGWLSALSREFAPETGMVVGPTSYMEPSQGFSPAEGTRALEFVSYGIVAAGLVGLGFPVIANANNIVWRREAFDSAGAFSRHGSVVSGDDDFTLQEIHATGKWKIRHCARAEASVRTAPPETWGLFWEQRKRWAGKCLHYRAPQLAFLLAIYAFYATIAVLLLAGLFRVGDPGLGLLGLTGLAVKTAADFAVMREGLALFGLSPLLRYFPFTAALHLPLSLAAPVAGAFGTFTWKGQRMKRKAK